MIGSATYTLQGNATANGVGTSVASGQFDSAQMVEIVESGGGTATVNLLGSFDGSLVSGQFPYQVGYQQVDGVASLSRSVAAISVTANSRHVFQVLDPYPQLMAAVSAVAGGANVTVRLFAVP